MPGLGIGITPKGGEVNGSTVLIFPAFYNSIGQGTWAATTVTGHWGGTWYSIDKNDGDNISYEVYLTAGTYTLFVFYKKDTSYGIWDFDIDGAEVFSMDGYAASGIHNLVASQAGISVASSGIHTLRMRVDGKNGSSSDYGCVTTLFALVRTA